MCMLGHSAQFVGSSTSGLVLISSSGRDEYCRGNRYEVGKVGGKHCLWGKQLCSNWGKKHDHSFFFHVRPFSKKKRYLRPPRAKERDNLFSCIDLSYFCCH